MSVRPRSAAAAALLACLLTLTACEKGTAVADRVAVVNGRAISTQTFDAYVQRRSGGTGELDAEARDDLLQQVISIELLMQEAMRQGLDREPRTAGELAVQRATLLANAAIRSHLEQNPVTDEAVRALYDERAPAMRQTEYHARHILVPSEAEANEILGRLKRGQNFERLARTRSTDRGSAEQGGDLGWFSAERMVKPFADAVVALAPEGLSEAPVQSQFGWHIIKVEGRRDLDAPAFEELSERLRGELQNQAVEAYINGLRGTAEIDVVGGETPVTEPVPASG